MTLQMCQDCPLTRFLESTVRKQTNGKLEDYAFQVTALLGESLASLEDNDPDGDPEEDVFEEARAECENIGLDLSKLALV